MQTIVRYIVRFLVTWFDPSYEKELKDYYKLRDSELVEMDSVKAEIVKNRQDYILQQQERDALRVVIEASRARTEALKLERKEVEEDEKEKLGELAARSDSDVLRDDL